MRFGLQFTLQLPRPWTPDAEQRLLREALAQVELADELGFDTAWAVEQHFLEEYSHSSAPEVFLGAASQRTTRIRLGHGVALLPPRYNHPARVAERVATLDLLSGGRVEFGVGDSKSRAELEGFGIDPARRRDMTAEALREIARMLVEQPYGGHRGEYFSMPSRNVVPKPAQRPHPPLWMACSDTATIHRAARYGIGALAHTFPTAAEAAEAVTGYEQTFASECEPIGSDVNPAVAMLLPFYCHEDAATARDRGLDAYGFFTYAVRHYYSFGRHRAGRSDVHADYLAVLAELSGVPAVPDGHAFGDPKQLIEYLGPYEQAGLDQIVLLHQMGGLSHAEITQSMRLFAGHVMPHFASSTTATRAKDGKLRAASESALARRSDRAPAHQDVPVHVDAYGRSAGPLSAPPASPPRDDVARLQRMRAIAMGRDDPDGG